LSEDTRILLFSWVPVVVYAGIIFYFSSIPGTQLSSLKIRDALLHCAEYAPFGFLLYRAFRNTRRGYTKKTLVLISFLALFLYGCSDEIHQMFVIGREASVLDIAYDCLGGIIGIRVAYS